jgi:hypothetical protein
VLLCLKTETELASKTQKFDDGEVQKKKISHALFSLLDFLALEGGTDRLYQNVSIELPFNAA